MMKAVLFLSVVFLGLQIVLGKCINGCAKTNATELYQPFTLGSRTILSKSTFEKLVLDKYYLGILQMHDGEQREHNWGLELKITQLSDGKYKRQFWYDNERMNPSCVNGTAVMEYNASLSNGNAAFNSWVSPYNKSVANCTEVWFSSCPERYIWKSSCLDNCKPFLKCPSHMASVTLMVPRNCGMAEADDLPWRIIADDLLRKTKWNIGSYSDIPTVNIYGVKNTCGVESWG